MSSPRISLCLIVRDESASLQTFLPAVAGMYDELVAVDTGSRDDTPERLVAAGARLERRPWTDDFSAARNASLALATGDWLLVLDPDEQPARGSVESIRATVADETIGAATVRMQNRLPSGIVTEAPLLRLFRRDPRVRFRYRVHEDAGDSVEAMLRATGRRRAASGATFLHLGYDRALVRTRGKKERDERLLRLALADDPDDLYAHFKRLELARFHGDAALAQAAAPEAHAALTRADDDRLGATPVPALLAVLVAGALHAGRPADELAGLLALAPRLAPSAEFTLRLAELHEALGRADDAAAAFACCLALASTSRDPRVGLVRPQLGLARLALARGALDEAGGRVTAALQVDPLDREALLAGLFLARALGGADAIRGFLSAHRASVPDPQALDRVVAELLTRP